MLPTAVGLPRARVNAGQGLPGEAKGEREFCELPLAWLQNGSLSPRGAIVAA